MLNSLAVNSEEEPKVITKCLTCHSHPKLYEKFNNLRKLNPEEVYSKLILIRDYGRGTTMHIISQSFNNTDLKEVANFLGKNN